MAQATTNSKRHFKIKPMKYYQIWAFRLFIYVVTLNIVTFFLTVSYSSLIHDTSINALSIMIFGGLATICLLAGMVMVALCIKNKAVNNTKTWVATIGLSFFFIVSIVFRFVG